MSYASILQLHNAANANQKEKYEADLKKEIKKLQVRPVNHRAVKTVKPHIYFHELASSAH